MSTQHLIGHADALGLVRRGIVADRLSHAYLITGPRGVGRRTLAVEMARALNCTAEPGNRPCGTCRACRLIGRNVHPDVRVVKRAPERGQILLRAQPGAPVRDYADNVEFIQADAQLRPADGRKKVYLILNAEDLRPDAANRLLKTIEEPTEYVHFLLTASDRGAVLPTIASRCQEIRLGAVAREDIAGALVDRGLAEPERANRLAALAAGRPGWALAAAADPAVLEAQQADVQTLRDALAATRLGRLALGRSMAERWGSQPESIRTTLRTWLRWWRDVLLTQVGLADRTAFLEEREREAVRRASTGLESDQVRDAQARTSRALVDLDANVNPRLALDALLLGLPQLPAE